MIKTRDVFNYTLQSGRDLFDDMEQLDCQHARMELGKANEFAKQLSITLEILDRIGIDVEEIDLQSLLEPTIPPEDDDEDFIMDEIAALHSRAMKRFPKCTVEKALQSFIISEHINDTLLLDAPYDIAMNIYNDAIKEQNRQMSKR